VPPTTHDKDRLLKASETKMLGLKRLIEESQEEIRSRYWRVGYKIFNGPTTAIKIPSKAVESVLSRTRIGDTSKSVPHFDDPPASQYR
jgi:hypothetical protein